MAKVKVDTKGIKNRLKSYKAFKSIAEYIWNGFDAGSTSINIDFSHDDNSGNISNLSISDNGSGIDFDLLVDKFEPVLKSEKKDYKQINNTTLIHGQHGLGRLTFYHFSRYAKWTTTYKKGEDFFDYSINVNSDALDDFDKTKTALSQANKTGTIVTFTEIDKKFSKFYFDSHVVQFIKKEFCWFLELYKDLGYSIKINNVALDYEDLIGDRETTVLKILNLEFNVNYTRWKTAPNRQPSRYIFTSSDHKTKYYQTTKFNRKGDSFHHSLTINSLYFDNFIIGKQNETKDHFNASVTDNEFKELTKNLDIYVRSKRTPLLHQFAKDLVEEYEKNSVFPNYNSNDKYESLRAEDLKSTVKSLYEIEPSIFKDLNKTQKKTFVAFLNLMLSGSELDDLFTILESVIDIDSAQREQFAKQLNVTKLGNIIESIDLIIDRKRSVEDLGKLVFDKTLYAKEVPHLQAKMEKCYWLLGEHLQLVTAAEPKFQEALDRYSYLLRGEKPDNETKEIVEGEHKLKEMDLFLTTRTIYNDKIENIVVELKHPTNIRLGKKEIDQVINYYQQIKSIDGFNTKQEAWKFYLIGNKYDGSEFIEDQINNLKHFGEKYLAYRGKYDVYVVLWEELFTDFEIKHNFLLDKLSIQRDKLIEGENLLLADDFANVERSSDQLPEVAINI
ncbi:ATP-binding protein [Cognaticolwellia aestuarii]|uniref:ATP-binding protein n=1 Tax=Cognaticolwellia aestuarii TaxID=329993 RepID=UPI00098646EE|nr:ATP-binding protein [Cognaticolwellia aestuarii]